MASKGKRKDTIRDIGRHWPSPPEVKSILDSIDLDQHSIVVAVLAVAMLEYDLERLLRPKFQRKDDATWARLTSENGPLSSFAQKISTAHAFGIIDEKSRKALIAMKNIRNLFAHSKKLVEFDNPLIVEEMTGIQLPTKRRSKILSDYLTGSRTQGEGPFAKTAFIYSAMVISSALTKTHTRKLQSSSRYFRKKLMQYRNSSPIAQAFQSAAAETLGQSGKGLHNAGPITLNEILGLQSISDHTQKRPGNEGK